MNRVFPQFKTDRIVLRQFTDADLPHVYEGLSHPDVIRYYGISFDSLEGTTKQMEFFRGLEETGKGRWWAICSATCEDFYGACGLSDISHRDKKAELGLWLLPKYWGQGIMREALPLIYSYSFENLGLHRLEAFVESENVPCQKLLADHGFIAESRMKDCEMKNGRLISLDVFVKNR